MARRGGQLVACLHCGAQWRGVKPEHCTVCHRTFGGTTAGDRHRFGAPGTPERRCGTDEDLCQRGLTAQTVEAGGVAWVEWQQGRNMEWVQRTEGAA
jgi:hypothetical protein